MSGWTKKNDSGETNWKKNHEVIKFTFIWSYHSYIRQWVWSIIRSSIPEKPLSWDQGNKFKMLLYIVGNCPWELGKTEDREWTVFISA